MTSILPSLSIPSELGLGDARVVIAVLDGPVDRAHPAFHGARLRSLRSLAGHEGTAGPAAAHGTHVASIIFGQPGSVVAGIAPHCTGLLIPIFSDRPDAKLSCSQLDLARAIDLAVDQGAHVINISGGQLVVSAQPEVILAQVLEKCARRNVLVVAAAGNDGCECLHLPAAAGNVLAVGAMDENDQPLPSSNWGLGYLTQGILAPGHDIAGAAIGGGVAYRSGTSFATPCVAGIAGLLIARQLARGQLPDPQAVRTALLEGATRCDPDSRDDCRRVLSGRLNIYQTVQRITGGVIQMSDTATLNPVSIPSFDDVSSNTENTGIALAPTSGGGSSANASREMREAGVGMSDLAALVRARAVGTPRATSASVSSRMESTGITPSCGCGGEDKCACGGGDTCSCGGGGAASGPQLVYALGRIGYDFGTDARRDSFIQAMPSSANNPYMAEQLLSYLDTAPYEAPALIWTLNLDATPVYAIQPIGAFAAAGYERLRECLSGEINDGVELVSVPGVIAGNVRLQSGQVVPVIVPALRGIYAWSTHALVQHVIGPRPEDTGAQPAYDDDARGLTDFLNRIYYQFRNLGVTSEDRAMNFSATNAVQVAEVIRSATSDALDLDTLTVRRSPICRPDSDCFDVEISFFNPNNTNIASRIFCFTIDVSDVIPVSIGEMRSWTQR